MNAEIATTDITNLHKKADAWFKAEQCREQAVYDLVAATYQFQHDHTNESILSYLDKQGISVVKGNAFTAVCKLAMAKFYNASDEEKKLGDANVSKWATAMLQLEANGIKPEDCRQHLEDNSITALIKAYRESLPSPTGEDEQLTKAMDSLRNRASMFDNGEEVNIKIDLVAAKIEPGLHNLIVDVDTKGVVEVLGFSNDNVEAVKQDIKRTLPASSGHPYDNLHSIIRFAGAVKHGMSKDNKKGNRVICIQNVDKGLSYTISTVGERGSVIATQKGGEYDPNLPTGFIVLSSLEASVFTKVMSKFKSAAWTLGEYKNDPVITVTNDNEIKQAVVDINNKMKASWQKAKDEAKESGKKISENPPHFEMPEDIIVEGEKIHIPLANETALEGVSLAVVKPDTTWADACIPFDDEMRDWLLDHLRDKDAKDTHTNIKITPKTFAVENDDGDTLVKKSLLISLPENVNEEFSVYKDDLKNALVAAKGAGGDLAMRFTQEMIRFATNNNGVSNDVFIPIVTIKGYSTRNQKFGVL